MPRLIEFAINYAIAGACCIYLFTLGVFSSRNRTFIRTVCIHFGRLYKPVRPTLAEIELASIVPKAPEIVVLEPLAKDGNVSLFEIMAINQIIRAGSPRNLFELGTFDGRTTVNMAANAGKDSKVFTIDLPEDRLESAALPVAPGDPVYIRKTVSGARYRGTAYEGKIVQVYGDTATFNFSPHFNKFDLVFVDAAHSYEYVINDSRVALRLLREGKGTILWHDYDAYDGVTQALNEFSRTEPRMKDLRRIKGTNLVYLVLD